MKIIYTRHALERMKQRGINPKEIKSAIKSPDGVIKGKQLRFTKLIGNKLLVVICRETDDALLVITAFKTSKIEKYLPRDHSNPL